MATTRMQETWDAYVATHPDGWSYHASGWGEVLRRAYGGTPMYLALEDAGILTGVLPLMRTRGLLTGVRYRSLPVLPPAGPLGDTPDHELALIDRACDLARGEGAAWNFKSRREGLAERREGLRRTTSETSWVVELPSDPDEYRRSIKKGSKNLDRSLKKALRGELTVRPATTDADLKGFHRVYLETMRRHRSLPRRYAQLLAARDVLGPRGVFRLFVAEHRGEVVAGAWFNSFGGTIDLLYNGSDPGSLDLRPNHALYWAAAEWAIENGVRKLDFGTASSRSSLGRFKQQWGAEPVREYGYEFSAGDRASRATQLRGAASQAAADEEDSSESLANRLWGKAPLSATALAGDFVYRVLV